MSDSNKEISLIDLIEYYEPGPVLKERTPDLNRVSFHPGDGEYYDGDDAPPVGKSITSSTRRRWLSKKALGLTDVPIHGTPGNIGAFRQRDEYGEEDEEAQFTTGFGGPSELDNFLEKEDKSPTNISRKLNADKKLKTLGDLDKMSFQKSELLKLAKALRFRGQDSFAHRVEAIAFMRIATNTEQEAAMTPEQAAFLQAWKKAGGSESWVVGQVTVDKNKAFFLSCYGEVPGAAGLGTQEGLMLHSLLHNPDQAAVNELFGKTQMRGSYGFGKQYKDMTIEEIVRAELSDDYLKAAEAIMNGTVNLQNFNPIRGEFKEEQPSEGGEAAPSQGETAERPITTQMRTPTEVQVKINEVFRGPLLPRVKDNYLVDAEGNQMTDSRGNPVAIPIGEDGKFGPQTTAAFNAATNKNYAPYKWPITVDAAYTMLDSITADTPADTAPAEGTPVEGEAPGEAGAGETNAGEGEGAIVSGDGRVRYMTREEFGVDYWIAQSPQYRGQIVGVGKSGTSVAGDIVFMDGRFSETTYNGERLVRPSDQHALVMPVEAREGRNFPGQPQTLTAREKRKLLDVIKPNVEKEEFQSFRRILGGSIQEGRTGGFTSRRSRARGQKRQDRGRSEIR